MSACLKLLLLFLVGLPTAWPSSPPPSHTDARGSKAHEAVEWNNKGVQLAKQRRFRDAVKAFEHAVQLDRKFAEAYYNLGSAHMRLESFEKAATALSAAVQVDPKYTRAWYQMGIALHSSGELVDAAKAYLTTLTQGVDSANLRYRMGLVFMSLKEWDQVAFHWDWLVQTFPEHPEALKIQRDLPLVYYNQGLNHQKAGRLKPAERAYRKTIRLRSDFADAHNNLALLYKEQERWPEAAGAYREVLRSRPDDPIALAALSEVYIRQDSLKQAVESLRRALELQPGDGALRRRLVFALARQGDTSRALVEANRVLRMDPEDPEGYGLRAFVLEHNSEGVRYGPGYFAGEAIESYERALSIDSTRVDYLYNLGVIHGRQANWNEALAAFYRARAIDSTHAGVRKWLPVLERQAQGKPVSFEFEIPDRNP